MVSTKSTIISLCVVFMVCLGITTNTFAQSTVLKIGFVDLQRVIDSSLEGKRAQEEVQKKADELSQRAKQMKDELQIMKEEFEKQMMALSEEAKRQKRDEIGRLERDYNRFITDSKSELRLTEQRALKELLEDLGRLVVEYGKSNNYTVILEAGNILYGDSSIDLTDEIIKLYNSKNQ